MTHLSPLMSWAFIGAIATCIGLIVALSLAHAARRGDELSEHLMRQQIHDENLAKISRNWYR